MIGWVVQATALSLCMIAVLHYLYVFFKTTLTVPKVKDLVNRPQKQYDAIFKTMGKGGTTNATSINGGSFNRDGGARETTGAAAAAAATTTDISMLPILGASGGGDSQRTPWENRENRENREGASILMKQELKHFLKELNSNNR